MVDKGQWWTMDKGGVVYLQLNTEHGAVHSSAGARAGAAVILAQIGHLELR